jgi:hypothetical protein
MIISTPSSAPDEPDEQGVSHLMICIQY